MLAQFQPEQELRRKFRISCALTGIGLLICLVVGSIGDKIHLQWWHLIIVVLAFLSFAVPASFANYYGQRMKD